MSAPEKVRDDEDQKFGIVTAADYARSIGQPPILTSEGRDWGHVSLHRFQVPWLDIKLAASFVHRVTLHLAGPILIERTREGHHDRRWSVQGASNLVPAGVPVSRTSKGQADFVALYIDPRVVDEVAADVVDFDPDCIRLTESLAEVDEVLERIVRLLLAEAEHGGVGTRLFTDTLTRALALHLLRAYSADVPRSLPPSGALVGWRLRRAIEYMHVHIADDVPLAQIALAAGLSSTHFARAFRAATGVPPYRYMIGLRIEKARHLLEHTRLPVIEIGFRCGFEQATHFATIFRKTTGLSPRAYRTSRCT